MENSKVDQVIARLIVLADQLNDEAMKLHNEQYYGSASITECAAFSIMELTTRLRNGEIVRA